MRDLASIQWTLRSIHAPPQEQDVAVLVDVQLIDEKWRKTDQYVGAGGRDEPESKCRYDRFGRFVEVASFIDMPEACFEDGSLEFHDGRHRFAWLRDHGLKVMPVAVAPESKAEFERLFGPREP